jgi:hypothetical protein
MPRPTSLLAVAFLLFGITGCARGPELVWVDTVPAVVTASGSSIVPAQSGLAPLSGSLEPIAERQIVTEDAAQQVRLAIAKIIEDQQELFADLRKRLYDQLAAEIRVEGNAKRDAMIAAYQEQVAIGLDKLSQMLADHAKIVGPKWHRLAWLSGFPDPDPLSRRRAREGDFIAEQRLAEAKRLREEIKLLQADFDARSKSILDDLRDGLRVDEAVLADDIAEQIEAAKTEADRQAQEAAVAAVKDVEQSALDLDNRVEAVPGKTSTTPAISGAPAERWTNPAASFADRERLQALARVFAAAHGWKLAEKPAGATDRTKEFNDWLKKRERPGLSANLPR